MARRFSRLAEYRNGRHDTAVEWLQRSLGGDASAWFRVAQCHTLLAMVAVQRGDTSAAQEELKRARKTLVGWEVATDHDWIMCQLLLQEAENLVPAVEQ